MFNHCNVFTRPTVPPLGQSFLEKRFLRDPGIRPDPSLESLVIISTLNRRQLDQIQVSVQNLQPAYVSLLHFLDVRILLPQLKEERGERDG